jgi:putative hemolysin
MTGSTLIEILVILVLILANGFFAASEMAVVSARRSQLERQVAAGKRGARRALALAEKPEYFLATVGIGIELIGTFTAAFGGDRLAATLEEWFATLPALAGQPGLRQILALLAVVLPLTLLTMLLGELVPKRLALRHAIGIATFSAPLLTTLGRLLRPLVALLSCSACWGRPDRARIPSPKRILSTWPAKAPPAEPSRPGRRSSSTGSSSSRIARCAR